MSESPCTGREIELSVVVRMVGGGVFLERCLQRLTGQIGNRSIEIIVPCRCTAPGISALRKEFPQVRFLELGSRAAHAMTSNPAADHQEYDRATAAGLRAAQGRVVASLEDFGVPDGDWCTQVLRAHRQWPHAAIGGAIEHAGSGSLNWAVYWLDFGRYQRPFEAGPARTVSDVNVSYKREALERVRAAWSESYNEVTTHAALVARGEKLWQDPRIVVRQDRGKLSRRHVLRERFGWGRIYGAVRSRQLSRLQRAAYCLLGPLIPAVLVARILRKSLSRPGPAGRVLLCLPDLAVCAAVWTCGELAGYVTYRADAAAPQPADCLEGLLPEKPVCSG